MEPSFIYEAKGQTLIIHMPAELDHHNSRNLRYETDLLMSENYVSKIIFDFSRTTFMDSSGIAFILRAHRRMLNLNGGMLLCHVPRQAKRVLDAAGIGRLVRIQ